MRILALDTTTRAGSVALVEDGRVVDERSGDAARTHAERLPGDIGALLDARGLGSSAIDLYAVASGPGSFTGLRIGIATIQGLAFVQRRKVAPVSALEALAHIARAGASRSGDEDVLVGVWMNAQRGDVFTALYRIRSAPPFHPGGLEEVDAPRVAHPEQTLEAWAPFVGRRPVRFIGDGAAAWADTIHGSFPDAPIAPHPPLAGAIGRLAVSGAAVEPGEVRPLYVRRPDAEIERDARRLRVARDPSRGSSGNGR